MFLPESEKRVSASAGVRKESLASAGVRKESASARSFNITIRVDFLPLHYNYLAYHISFYIFSLDGREFSNIT
ncbi:hypothetical protein C0J52_06266 [Blattella germanica]|nr:hypothetical protein C0J52_06266 [Blattella germanica]